MYLNTHSLLESRLRILMHMHTHIMYTLCTYICASTGDDQTDTAAGRESRNWSAVSLTGVLHRPVTLLPCSQTSPHIRQTNFDVCVEHLLSDAEKGACYWCTYIVFACIPIYIYICIYVYIYMLLCIVLRWVYKLRSYFYMLIYVYVCMYAPHVVMHMCKCFHCMEAWLHLACIYICTCIYPYIHTYAYTHTYMHIYPYIYTAST